MNPIRRAFVTALVAHVPHSAETENWAVVRQLELPFVELPSPAGAEDTPIEIFGKLNWYLEEDCPAGV